MIRSAPFVLAAALVLVPIGSHACVDDWLQRQAYAMTSDALDKNGSIVYRESLHHEAGANGGVLRVHYTLPDGGLLASKTVEYDCRPTTPSYKMSDADGRLLEAVIWAGSELTAQSGESSEIHPVPEGPAIVDAGFDNTIKLHWEELIRGETLDFNYFFVRQGRFVKLRFARDESPPESLLSGDDDLVHFRITPSNTFLRLFAKPLNVSYNRGPRELRYYYGPTNLPMLGDVGRVLIRYTAITPPLQS